MACSLFYIGRAFNFADLFGDGGRSQEESNESASNSSQRSKETICAGFRCPDGTCADTPIDCSCPEGKRKCYTNDWYVCIPSNEECPSGTRGNPSEKHKSSEL